MKLQKNYKKMKNKLDYFLIKRSTQTSEKKKCKQAPDSYVPCAISVCCASCPLCVLCSNGSKANLCQQNHIILDRNNATTEKENSYCMCSFLSSCLYEEKFTIYTEKQTVISLFTMKTQNNYYFVSTACLYFSCLMK